MPASHQPAAMPKSWGWLLFLFSAIGRRRLRKSFRALRMLRPEILHTLPPGPVVIYLNHPSWWDPIVCAELARRLLRGRKHRAPISALSLQEYPFFRHMGLFPVEQSSRRGVTDFLRNAGAVLANNGVLWITAQGHFTDARVRPVELMSGLGALLQRTPSVTVVPLAMEYTFWNQRLPEVLVAAGDPIHVDKSSQRPAREWTDFLEHQLEQAQNRLASASLTRNPAVFTTLLEGRKGMAGPYAMWQAMRAALQGKAHGADHHDYAVGEIQAHLPARSSATELQ